jgi:DNA-binding PadR family transcriptional regulator
MSPFQIYILELIKTNDGKLSWYQIDRALSQRTTAGIVPESLMPALRELEQGGFITTGAGHNPGQPLYSITPAGQQQLARSA